MPTNPVNILKKMTLNPVKKINRCLGMTSFQMLYPYNTKDKHNSGINMHEMFNI